MKQAIVVSATLLALVGCGQSEIPKPPPVKEAPATAPASTNPAGQPKEEPSDKPREATYNPDLKPAPIVRDTK